MILFLNTRITSARINPSLYGNTSQVERVDIFKYYLSSLTVMLPLISKVFINSEISEEFHHRQDEIRDYIKTLFPENKLVLKNTRSNNYDLWKEDCERINSVDDNVIWYSGNDDQIFIDSNLNVVKDGVELLESEQDPMSFLYYSHWPEAIRTATMLNAELDKNKNLVKFKWGRFDSIKILRKERFNEYWSEPKFCTVNRSDELVHHRPEIMGNAYCPIKEIVRHFDGYAHVGYFNNSCPFLSIPKGFFENNIRIKYGYDDRDENYTNINPASENFLTHDPKGVDYKWCLEDIPLFWKDKIKEININPNADLNVLKQKRNEFFCTKPIESCVRGYGHDFNKMPPQDWFVKHLL